MRTLLRLPVVLLLVASGACAHFTVAPDATSPSTLQQQRKVHAAAWGALEPKILPPNCNGAGLASVTVRVTVVDTLLAIGTLGFLAPVTVYWTCAKTSGVSR